ncbi:hypothetical protein KP509_37G049200 [Ceratopteris richardii]|nr:hypothetical protein KP509_37G049200 [Ceratopteris richardii]
MLVAVKKLNKDSLQGDKEWLAELKYLGALRHPNVVKLFGYCCEGDHRLLVYEFFPRGSLENHLFGRSGHTLPWNTRLKIAVDAAKGLTFLHNAKIPVIYRDFKSSNILLDSEFNAKLSDFGLAKDGPTGDKTHVTTQVLGTYGYAAPEYVATGKLTPKSDVYGFGVVLLEILTGKRAVDKARNGGEINLVEWATPYLIDKRKWSRVLDQRLDGQYSFKGAHIAANVSLQCLCSDPKLRPTMQDVLESLQPLVDPKASASARSSSKSKGKSPYNTPNRDRKDINVSKQGHEVDADAKPTIAFKLPSPTHDASKLQKQDPSVCPSPTASPLRMK